MRARFFPLFLTLLAMTCALPAADGQSFYNVSSTVSVLPGTLFSVKDSLVNTGIFINNGNLVIGGTWYNTGTYNPGAGEITFNSTTTATPQIINHSNQSFTKLTISGGGRKLILADVTIEGQLVLEDGVIEAENNSRVTFAKDATITGGTDASHIHAPVYHRGSGDKLFPLGNGTLYLPARLPEVGDAAAFIGIEQVELDGVTLMAAPALQDISRKRYWKIDVAAGSLQSRVALGLRDENLSTDLQKIAVVESPSLTENFDPIGQSLAEGTVSNGMVTSDRKVSHPFVALASAANDRAILVYNAISPNGDSDNEFLRIGNIEYYPENKVTVFNRWGDKVFEIDNYDNLERVFRGKSNVSGETDIVNGTYFYVIDTGQDNFRINGFLVIKR